MIEMFGVKLRQMKNEERNEYDADCLRELCNVSTHHEGLLLCLWFTDKDGKLPHRGTVINRTYNSNEVVALNKAYVNGMVATNKDMCKHDCWIFFGLKGAMTDDVRNNPKTFYVYNGMLLKEELR